MYLIYIGLAVVTGLILAAETALNAQLSALLKSPIIACFVAYTVGTIILFCMTIMIGDFQKIQHLFSVPIWPLTGGLFGLVFVMSCIMLFPKIGAVETVMLPTLGQILSGMLFETVGWFSLPIINLSLSRVGGLFILLVGIYVAIVMPTKVSKQALIAPIPIKKSAQPLNRIWAFVAGVLCTVQSIFNGQLANDVGSSTVSAFWVFFIGFVVLACLKQNSLRNLWTGIKLVPAWLAGTTGALFVTFMSMLILPLGPGLTVSISTLGVMVGAVLVQQFGLFQSVRVNISRYQIIGIITMLLGIMMIKML
ncbi:DMT family transporter [Leuconostoc sp. MS02]|uniref:DMT family transporter n=1 Tax=Leuconostoc aquikimchii TaxID=3236804 RepID=A0ABV3S023_9LACO